MKRIIHAEICVENYAHILKTINIALVENSIDEEWSNKDYNIVITSTIFYIALLIAGLLAHKPKTARNKIVREINKYLTREIHKHVNKMGELKL